MSNEGQGKEQEKIYLSGRIRRLLLEGDREDLTALRDAGLLDEQALKVLESMRRGLDGDYKDNRFAKNLIRTQQSKIVNKAVQEGKGDLLSHIVGEETSQADISSLQLFKKLKNHIDKQGRVWQFKGNTNSGKTNLAVIFAELFKESTNGKILSNMESLKQAKTVKSFKGLKQESEKEGRFLFIGEDFSNHASGYAEDLKKVKGKARKWTNELAKLSGNAILLGHTGMDIHKDLRRKAYLVDNTSKKQATIYRDSKNGKGQNKVMQLNNIPKASWSYNPDERTQFIWQTSQEVDREIEELEEIEKEIKQRLKSQREIKTTEIDFNSQKVAKVMRRLAKANSDILKFEESASPKELQRRA